MLKKIKQFVAALAVTFVFCAPVLAAAPAGAQEIEKNLKCGSNFDATLGSCNDDVSTGESKINTIIKDVINIFSLVVGVVSVIMIIVGGFKYITSGGASDGVTSAKNTIMYAIIGLVIVALAQFIVRFVLSRVTA